jgi:UDP-N-acetylmuramate dehydrogenase
VTEQVLLGAHTTFGTGGPARFWATAATPDAVVRALGWAEARALPVVVLGGGSNVLVADRGLEALVLRVRTTGMLVHERAGTVRVVAGAGLVWDELVGWAVERGLAGIECLAGIPGEVGAAPVQNIGAYGQEVAECVEAVAVIDRATGARRVVAHAQCGFGYRHSAFKEPGQQEVIVSVTLRLRPGGPATMRYAELARSFERSGVEPGLAEVRATVLALRRGKSMVLDASDENRRSAGSFFVNPTLDADALARLRERAAAVLGPNESLPQHPAPNGATKVPAAWLIERAGLGKGFGQGAVGLSTRHTLAIVNRGGASSQDVLAFAGFVRQRVLERFGVGLVPEVRLLGFEPAELAAVGL